MFLVLVHRTVVFYNKTRAIFHFGPLSIPNFALKGCHPKVHTKHYFLSKYLFAIVIDKLSFLEYNIVNCTYSRRTPRYLLHNHLSSFLIISQMHSQDASHVLRGEREETRCRTLDQENLRDRTNIWSEKTKNIQLEKQQEKHRKRTLPKLATQHRTYVWESWSGTRVVITHGWLPGPAGGGRKGSRDGKKHRMHLEETMHLASLDMF